MNNCEVAKAMKCGVVSKPVLKFIRGLTKWNARNVVKYRQVGNINMIAQEMKVLRQRFI